VIWMVYTARAAFRFRLTGQSVIAIVRHPARLSHAVGMRSCTRAALAIVAVAAVSDASAAGPSRRFPKLDAGLEHRAVVASTVRISYVIVSLRAGSDLPPELKQYARADRLDSINALVLDLPDSQLAGVSKLAAVTHVHAETTVHASNFR